MSVCDYCGKQETETRKLTNETINTIKSLFIRTPQNVKLCPLCMQRLKLARYNAEADFYKKIVKNRKRREKNADYMTLDEYEKVLISAYKNAPEK